MIRVCINCHKDDDICLEKTLCVFKWKGEKI
jgi:hypothetical protein